MCKQSPTRGTPGAAATYTAFLDALLTNVCCADKGAIDVDADIIVSGRDGVIGDEDVSTDGASTSNNRSGNDGSKSPTKDVSNNDTATPMVKEPLAESILPLLRFNPLMSTSIRQNENIPSSISSLDEFFDLFLRDDAPHSFLSFHKSKGDEEIKATPWKMGQEDDKLERTITFITKFTPKNLQEPQDEGAAASSTKTITDISNPTLTLAVTSRQTLSRQPSTMILDSLLSFDFVDNSLFKARLNLSLTQFLISNDVKGSEVNVRVVLKEGNGGIDSATVNAAASGEESVTHHFLLPDRLPSLLEDPFSESILEEDNHDGNNNNYKDGSGCDVMPDGNTCNDVISPTHIGASLLSAISARNCPTPHNSKSRRNPSPVDEAALLIAKHSESIAPTFQKRQNSSPSLLQRDIADDTYDVLRTASSRGSLKFKHVSSFEAGGNPGEMTMRRMLWEKDRSGSTARGGRNNVLGRDNTNTTSRGEPSSLSSLLLPFNLSQREGLSMRIEMEVRDSSNSNTTTLRKRSSSSNSSFPRTRSNAIGGPSLAYIEEKVRKGLKKRVARSWITWANSWCMRIWEDEQVERFLRKGSPAPMVRRRRSNTRPTVRRIGERKKKSPVRAAKNQTASTNVEMEKLSVMQKQIQSAESMKPRRVVTPTSSPIRENDKSVWNPLKVKNGNQSCRWMSSEEEDGQCGVEVCTITFVKSKGGGRSSPMKNIVRGLKSKS